MNLNLLLSILVCGIFSSQVFSKDELIGGAIVFRGKIDGNHFSGTDFDVVVEDADISILTNKTQKKFTISATNQKVADVVLSRDHLATAVAMNDIPWPGRNQTLTTVNAAGVQRTFKSRIQQMTKALGWIVELGAVSNDGSLVLAKCAFFLPKEGDMQRVNHKWIVLQIGEQSLEVVEDSDALGKWAAILESNMQP
ncbi:MAG TPA: hypothetical protein VLO11_01915 [Luteolibacter sp.]|nr:hypothetical protein [Luteolibacter sp.]